MSAVDVPSLVAIDNARSVVRAWRNNEMKPWTGDAANASPSQVNYQLNKALRSIASNFDRVADELVAFGFMPSHPSVTELRADASLWHRKANSQSVWCAALDEAESEFLPGIASTSADETRPDITTKEDQS